MKPTVLLDKKQREELKNINLNTDEVEALLGALGTLTNSVKSDTTQILLDIAGIGGWQTESSALSRYTALLNALGLIPTTPQLEASALTRYNNIMSQIATKSHSQIYSIQQATQTGVSLIPTTPELEADALSRFNSLTSDILGIGGWQTEADALSRYTSLNSGISAIPTTPELEASALSRYNTILAQVQTKSHLEIFNKISALSTDNIEQGTQFQKAYTSSGSELNANDVWYEIGQITALEVAEMVKVVLTTNPATCDIRISKDGDVLCSTDDMDNGTYFFDTNSTFGSVLNLIKTTAINSHLETVRIMKPIWAKGDTLSVNVRKAGGGTFGATVDLFVLEKT